MQRTKTRSLFSALQCVCVCEVAIWFRKWQMGVRRRRVFFCSVNIRKTKMSEANGNEHTQRKKKQWQRRWKNDVSQRLHTKWETFPVLVRKLSSCVLNVNNIFAFDWRQQVHIATRRSDTRQVRRSLPSPSLLRDWTWSTNCNQKNSFPPAFSMTDLIDRTN